VFGTSSAFFGGKRRELAKVELREFFLRGRRLAVFGTSSTFFGGKRRELAKVELREFF
jgi:hypothetical protein